MSTDRLSPSFWYHDWYVLRGLRKGIEALTAAHAVPAQHEIVADLGCGDQPYRRLFAERCAKYIGCDLAGDVDIQITPGQPVPIADGSVGGVVSFQVLEHVWELDWYLGECRRMLRPDGWLLLSTHGVWLYHPHPGDYRRWTRDGLCAELRQRGFAVEDVAPVVGPLAWTTQFRLFAIREAMRRVPVLGPIMLAQIAILMNGRMVVEDWLTPASIRDQNASVYITLSRKR